MNRPRSSAAPPTISGFEFQRLLGSGGFADVFLYEQRRPQRSVAVKVMRHDIDSESARSRFDGEADLMAQLSSHPFIVTIYQSDIAEDGRPFLVMEYCPLPNLGVRYKREPFGVAEALTTGIQLAGAIETVHRAGILHRDIKPANVLVTEYRRPALTDFGISVASHESHAAEGLSIPWSPPEAFGQTGPGGQSSDVYSLAATVYTLLAGRSPFEVPGGDNSALSLVGRTESAAVPRLGRSDIPDSLQQVFATALAKDPAARYGSALALARAWQQVQTELSMPLTMIEVREDESHDLIDDDDDDDDPGTRVRSVASIEATPRPAPSPPRGDRPAYVPEDIDPGTVARGGQHWKAAPKPTVVRTFRGPTLPEPEVASTLHRRVGEVDATPVAAAPERARPRWIVPVGIGAGVAVLAAGALLAVQGFSGANEDRTVEQDAAPRPVEAVAASVPSLTELTGTFEDGALTFTWTNPEPREGDRFLWRLVDPSNPQTYRPTEETELVVDDETLHAVTEVVDGELAERVCLEVMLRRADGRSSTNSTTGCVTP